MRHVIWVTLRQAGANASVYAQSNARIRSAGKRWRSELVVADWNAYSRGKAWFQQDGLHLSPAGALGLARLLRPLVVASCRTRSHRSTAFSTGVWGTGGTSRSERVFPGGQLGEPVDEDSRRRG